MYPRFLLDSDRIPNRVAPTVKNTQGCKILGHPQFLLTGHTVTRQQLLRFFIWFDAYFILGTIYSLVCCLVYSQRSLTASTMGFGFNSTVLPAHGDWSGYLAEAHKYLPDSTLRIALLAFINIPIIAIVLNVLRQLVRLRGPFLRCILLTSHRFCLKTGCYLRKSSTSFRFWVLHQGMGTTPLHSLSLVGKR